VGGVIATVETKHDQDKVATGLLSNGSIFDHKN
jgi:hypothetical protein